MWVHVSWSNTCSILCTGRWPQVSFTIETILTMMVAVVRMRMGTVASRVVCHGCIHSGAPYSWLCYLCVHLPRACTQRLNVCLFNASRNLRETKGVPRKEVWTSVNMRVWTCKESRAKHDQASCYLRPPFLGTPLAPSRVMVARRRSRT